MKRYGVAPGARSRPAIPTAQLTCNRRAWWIVLCLGLGLGRCCLRLWEADACGLGLFSRLHVSKGTCTHSPRGIMRCCLLMVYPGHPMWSEATDQPSVWGLPLGPPRLDVKTSPRINLAPATIPTPGGHGPSWPTSPALQPGPMCWPSELFLPGQWTQALSSALLQTTGAAMGTLVAQGDPGGYMTAMAFHVPQVRTSGACRARGDVCSPCGQTSPGPCTVVSSAWDPSSRKHPARRFHSLRAL